MQISDFQMGHQFLRFLIIMVFSLHCCSDVLAVLCSPKCTTCDTDTPGHVVKVVCTGVDIPTIPDSVQEMYLAEGKVSLPGFFKDYVFIGKTELRKIQLKKYGISMVWESPFINLTDLIEVDLSFNEIPDFDKSNLAGPVALQVLNLNHNKIQQILDDAFSNQTSLKQLWMSMNKVTRIPPHAFRGLTNVEHIDLSYNLLTTIDSQAFHHCTALKTVSLRGNRLNTVAPHLFQGLTHLNTVNLQRNHLVSIGQESFIGTNLTLLDLSRNNLHDVRSTMAILKNISGDNVEVILSANHLNTSYKAGMFSGVTLKLLDLQYNGLSMLPQDTFANNQIRNLKLAHNNLLSLPSNMEAYLKAVKPNISLDDNPWLCDCRLLWFSMYLRQLSPPDFGTRLQSTLKCHGPNSVQNHFIQDVATIIEPGCRTTMSTTTTRHHHSSEDTSTITTVFLTAKVPVQTSAGVSQPGLGPNGGLNFPLSTDKTSTPGGISGTQSLSGTSATMTAALSQVAGGITSAKLPQIVGGTISAGLPQVSSSIKSTRLPPMTGSIQFSGLPLVTGSSITFGPKLNNGQSKGQARTSSQSPSSSFPIGAVVGPLAALCVIGGAVGWFLYRKQSRGNNGKINSHHPHEPEESDYLWDKHHPVSRSLGPSKTYFNSNSLKNFHSYQL